MKYCTSTAVGIVILALAPSVHAQVTLSGSISDTTTGPLLTGTVYHVTGNVQVPTGQTLTIEPGVVVKFGAARVFTANGTLLVNGTGPGSVVFTDLRDDTAGGDTNGDGNATVPAPGGWRQVAFGSSSDFSFVRGLEVRYAGAAPYAGLQFSFSDATLEDCLVRDCLGNAWDLSTNSSPALTRCGAVDNGGIAFARVRIAAAAEFSGLTASGNGANWVDLNSNTVSGGTMITLGPQNGVNGVLHLAANLSVSSGGLLTLEAGTILKMRPVGTITTYGTLNIQGTAQDPVHVTDERDDTLGGDGNGDGAATSPAPGYWRYMDYRSTAGTSVAEHLELRYGGGLGSTLNLNSSTATFRHVVIRDSMTDGVDFNANSEPTMEDVLVRDCLGQAFNAARVQGLSGLTGLAAEGNGTNWINVTSANVAAGQGVTFGPQNGIQGVVRFDGAFSVQNGGQLTIQRGTICKFDFDGYLTVSGLLTIDGTSAQPVYFTDERDDTVGGDSNTDGAQSAPSAGWWRGITFANTSDGSAARYAYLRYGGRFQAGFEISSAAVTCDHCRVEDFDNDGIDCNNSAEPASFVQCVVERCAGVAINRVKLERLVDFIAPRGTGNDFDRIEVTAATIAGTVNVDPVNQFGGSVYLNASITVPASATLTFQPGVVMKMGFDKRILVQGALAIRGSLENPVIFTDVRDDSIGGDTNGDGSATLPLPGWWRGLYFNATADVSTVLGAELRYGGRSQSQVYAARPTVVLREVRSTFSSTSGFRLDGHPIEANRLVAYRCVGDGFDLRGGSSDLRQVTGVSNGGFGVRATAAWTGDVVDSIVRDNLSGALTGVGAGRVRYSNAGAALAGVDGNINVDPEFLDEPNGDLRLAQTSPCINTGDPASPLDPDSTRADMGAYFFNFCEPSVFCMQAVFPPCTPTLEYEGFCSLSASAPFWLRLPDAPTLSFAVFFYGIGAPTPPAGGPYGSVCVGGPYQRTPAIASGGDPTLGPCNGLFEFDFNDWAQSGQDPAVVAGANVIGTFWFRYGAAPNLALFSSAVEIPVCP